MEWIPYQRLTITTDLTRDEVIDRMRKWVGPKKRKNFVRVDNIFSGRLVKDKFEFNLHTDYRNSWTPVITGTIKETNGKVELLVSIRSNWFAIVGTGLFIIMGLTMLISEIVDYNENRNIDWVMILAFTVFPYGLCWFGFNLDADKSIDGLIKITKGEIK